MKKEIKRKERIVWSKFLTYIGGFLIGILMLMSVPISAKAEVQTGYVAGTGNAVSWSYDTDTKTITITGTGTRGVTVGSGPNVDDVIASRISSDFPTEAEYVVFQNCTISGSLDTLFAEMINVKSIDFSGLTTNNINNTEYMFYQCNSLTSLDISGIDTSNVINMRAMFCGCRSLSTLSLENFKTGSVIIAEYMFMDCSGLTVLDLRSFDTSNMVNIYCMFNGCSNMASLDLSSFSMPNLQWMDKMFDDCSSLNELKTPNAIAGGCSADLPATFYDAALYESTGEYATTDVLDSTYAGKTLKRKEEAGSPSSAISYRVEGDTVIITGEGTRMGEDDGEPPVDRDVLEAARHVKFENCKISGSLFMLFYRFSNLESIDCSGLDTTAVTYMWQVFDGCSGLTSLDVSGLDTKSVTNMWAMFQGCSSLTSLDLSGFDMSAVTDMNSMFRGCSSLITLITPHVIAAGQSTELPGTFYDATLYESTGEYVTTDILDSTYAGKTLRRIGTLPQAVKYVPFQHVLAADGQGAAGFALVSGTLPGGLNLSESGEISGIPVETGTFVFTVKISVTAADGSITETQKPCTLTVLDNSDANVAADATDPGYEITQPVADFRTDSAAEQTFVSKGEYSEFRDVYIDGVKLTPVEDYTSEAGSTRITIKSQTFARFNQPGTHTIVAEFRRSDTDEVKHAVQNYHVSVPDAADGSDDGNSGNDENGGSDENVGNDGNSGSDGNGGNSENDGNSGSDGAGSENSGVESSGGDSSSGTAAQNVRTPIYYTVVSGDTMNRIARAYRTTLSTLLSLNPQITNPHRIYPGQVLLVGYTINGNEAEALADASKGYHTVEKGDSFYKIARMYGVSLRVLMDMNTQIAAQKYIYAGQRIRWK